MKSTTRLRQLLQRRGRVLTLMHPPSARLARLMEAAGTEAGFVGTNGVVSAYTGLAEPSMMECVTVAGWIARSVSFPIIMDGDTGHGGPGAVRHMVEECIRAGIAGVRIEDLPVEGNTHEVIPLELAIARYRAAVDARDRLDPDFVIMAHTFARNTPNGGLEACLHRLGAYEQEAGVDWVQFGSPHSIDEIKLGRAATTGPYSFISLLDTPSKGARRTRYLTLEEHLALGVTIATFPEWPHSVTATALWDFMTDYQQRGVAAWTAFESEHREHPYLRPLARESAERGQST
jgi:2-methylisocitrate lyase-like PEP mutase family enzyme